MKELKITMNDDDIIELMKMYKTSDEAEALKMAVSEILKKQNYNRILALNGNVSWEGNLDEMRQERI
jgi:hypothetical protein